MALAKTTRNHDEIQKWAEARGGKPGAIKATEKADDPGILRLFFPKAPHHNDDAIEEISWEEFFEKFDESGLELTYQEKTADGHVSDFNKLTYPDPASPQGKKLLAKTAKRASAKKSAAKKTAGTSATKTASKTAGTKTAAESSPAKAAPAKKAPAKTAKTAKKSASRSSTGSASGKSNPATPARNYPKPEPGSSNGQVF